jgi:hypothetical protein
VRTGGLAVGAVAVLDIEPELAGFVLEQGLRFSEDNLPEFAPDGAWKEGPGYWGYTVQYLTFYMNSLQTALGTDYGYLKLHNIDKTAYFPIFGSSAQGSFNIGDAGAGLVNAPYIFYYAAQLKDGGLAQVRLDQMKTYNWGGNAWDLMYFRPEYAGGDTNLPFDKYFRYVEIASFRNSWTDPGALFGAIHGGDNAVPHGNLDCGTFVLDALGIRWAVDLGADAYELPNYFGTTRWTYYRCKGEGQNTIIINPQSGIPDQELTAFTTIERYETKDKGGLAVVNMTDAFGDAVKSAKRGLKMNDGRKSVTLRDEIEFKKASNDLWWFMHTKADIEISEDGKSAVLTQSGKQLKAVLMSSDKTAVFSQMDATHLPGMFNPSGQGSNEGTRKLCVNIPNAKGKLDINVEFIPLIDGNETEALHEETPIDKWEIADGELSNPTLQSITLDGEDYEEFDPGVYSYSVILPYGTSAKPGVGAKSDKYTVKITSAGDGALAADIIEVSDGAGETSTYYLQYKVMPFTGVPDGLEALPVTAVTASAEPQSENGKENVLDGDFDTRWSADGSHWIMLDLGKEENVEAVGVSFYLGDQRAAYYGIETSLDGKNFTFVSDLASSGLTTDLETSYAGGNKARYVRIKCTGTSQGGWNSITEIKVYKAVSTQ